MKKILLLLTIAVLSVFFITGCKKSSENSNVLVIGTNAEFPPFEYIDVKNSQIVGFDIELMAELAKIIGKEVEYKNMAFDSLLMAMQTGKINCIISGMTATEERGKYVDFTDAYFTSKQGIIVKEGSDINNFEGLEGKKIGVVIGYTGDTVVTEKYKDKADITRYNETSGVIMALTAGKIDVAVLDMEPAKEYAANNKGLKVLDTALAEESYSIALPKGSTELLGQLNNALKTIKENGTYDKIYAKYFK